MSAFMSTFECKLDVKGRVSVPAAFRDVSTQQGFKGIYVYPSFTEQAIEGGNEVLMQESYQKLKQLNRYSKEYNALSRRLLGQIVPLSFDANGRVGLPQRLLRHAGIDERLIFIGLGDKFQIWEPHRFDSLEEEDNKVAVENLGLLDSSLLSREKNE